MANTLPPMAAEVALNDEQLATVKACAAARVMPLDYVSFRYIVLPKVPDYDKATKRRQDPKPKRVVARGGGGMVLTPPKAVRIKAGNVSADVLTAKVDAGGRLGKVVAVLHAASVTATQPRLDGTLAGGRKA